MTVVMKFGGSSLANAERIARVAGIVVERAKRTTVGLVVSAVGGVTDDLARMVTDIGVDGQGRVDRLRARHMEIAAALAALLPGFDAAGFAQQATPLLQRLAELNSACRLIGDVPDHVAAEILSMGERLSCVLMAQTLTASGTKVHRMDSVKYLRTNRSSLEAQPDMEITRRLMAQVASEAASVRLMAGFMGGDDRGRITTLGRNGSDYSAAVMAVALDAERLEIWTDVAGVYTCDPRIVPAAQVVPRLGYAEVMELSYFGAKVLHPKTMAPVARAGIPTHIRNTLDPEAKGSVIDSQAPPSKQMARGISCLDSITLLDVSGPGLKGMCGMAARTLAAIAAQGISVNLMTQSSSEYTMSFCVPAADAAAAKVALEDTFELELSAGLLDPIGIREDMAILSLVGDGMRERRGVARAMFRALAEARVNIVAIAQGSSERSISVVCDREMMHPAMLAVHRVFFEAKLRLEVFLFGVGVVGGELAHMIEQQHDWLVSNDLDVRLCGVANSKRMAFSPGGFRGDDWRKALAASECKPGPQAIGNFIAQYPCANPVVVDCTSSDAVTDAYPTFIQTGCHLITANKKGNTRDLKFYDDLRTKMRRHDRVFAYSTNVGAGLPVISTLRRLMDSGDRLIRFEGILSGSLSYIFGLLEKGHPLSEAVSMARDNGFTEPDPRDDLGGMDVARKLLILARETGARLNLEDVVIDGILPSDFDMCGSIDAFMARLQSLDQTFATRMTSWRKSGLVPRLVGSIADGQCRVGIQPVALDHALAGVKDGENAASFITERYQPIPLTIRGYGAGGEITAAGVFGDLLSIGLSRAGV